jgi:hypothetical protein
MGPITLFDKSFLQSLSLDESVFFDRFFSSVICPIFYVETLADLEKVVRPGRTPEEEVRIIADKVPELGSYPCAYHVALGAGNLMGGNVPMDGRVMLPQHGRPVMVDGKVGFVHDEAPEADAFRRWQNREFLYVEREFARGWRTALNNVDLAGLAERIQAMGISAKTCRSLADAHRIVNTVMSQDGTSSVDQINMALHIFQVPPSFDLAVFGRWARRGRQSLKHFAPYAAHVVAVETFFQLALGADLLGTGDTHNRTDIGYLYYAPLCHVFVSSDRLHTRCAGYFLRKDQSFVWGPDLKTDLNRLMTHLSRRSEEEKEQGLYRLAPTPPTDDKGLTAQLWDRHLIKSWRTDIPAAVKRENPEEDKKIVEHINRIADAPALPHGEVNFEPEQADFMQLTRRVSKRKGSWWQLPKDIENREPS